MPLKGIQLYLQIQVKLKKKKKDFAWYKNEEIPDMLDLFIFISLGSRHLDLFKLGSHVALGHLW